METNVGDGTVEEARAQTSSLYQLYRRLIEARRRHAVLCLGDYRSIEADGDLFVFGRVLNGDRVLVLLNLGDGARSIEFPAPVRGVVMVSSAADRDGELIEGPIALAGDEGLVIALNADSPLPASIARR